MAAVEAATCNEAETLKQKKGESASLFILKTHGVPPGTNIMHIIFQPTCNLANTVGQLPQTLCTKQSQGPFKQGWCVLEWKWTDSLCRIGTNRIKGLFFLFRRKITEPWGQSTTKSFQPQIHNTLLWHHPLSLFITQFLTLGRKWSPSPTEQHAAAHIKEPFWTQRV